MTARGTVSSSTMDTLAMDKLRREKFALLARVGHLQKALSRSRAEAESFSSFAIESLAALEAARAEVALMEEPQAKLIESDITSEQFRLTELLCSNWPEHSEFQPLYSKVLSCAGLERMTVVTDDGYLSLSMPLMLGSVASIIEATKELTPRASSN